MNKLYYLPYSCLQDLIDLLNADYLCIGPQVKNDAIVYDVLKNSEQLPWKKRDKQAPGSYQLEDISEHCAFGWANGPQAVKPFLFKPYELLWEAVRDGKHLRFKPKKEHPPKTALFGVRACDIAAMAIQDYIFTEDVYVDNHYKKRREALFIVAANCTYASDNCFCVSAGGYPKAKDHFDLAMTEIDDGFVIETGTKKGKTFLNALNLSLADDDHIKIAGERVNQAAASQKKSLPNINLRDTLLKRMEHPRWNDVADRCLACGNCTQVCPTCFCHAEFDELDTSGSRSKHWRVWDSCFTEQHSYLHGGAVRQSTREFYRQWLTHKLGSWWDQFGMSGCVGCGRCITWCPVGIDITEEANALVEHEEQK